MTRCHAQIRPKYKDSWHEEKKHIMFFENLKCLLCEIFHRTLRHNFRKYCVFLLELRSCSENALKCVLNNPRKNIVKTVFYFSKTVLNYSNQLKITKIRKIICF